MTRSSSAAKGCNGAEPSRPTACSKAPFRSRRSQPIDYLTTSVLIDTDGTADVHLAGELDVTGVRSLRRAVGAALDASTGEVVVDLMDLRFLDVSGLRALDQLGREAAQRGRRVELANVSPRFDDLIALVGLPNINVRNR